MNKEELIQILTKFNEDLSYLGFELSLSDSLDGFLISCSLMNLNKSFEITNSNLNIMKESHVKCALYHCINSITSVVKIKAQNIEQIVRDYVESDINELS